MAARQVPSTVLRRLYSKNIDSAFLVTLIVEADDEAPLYLVNNYSDITYNSQVYSATQFTITLPSDEEDYIPESTVVFSDTQNVFLDLIRNYDKIDCTIEVIMAEMDGTPYETKVGPYYMELTKGYGDSSTATFAISVEDVGSDTFPNGTYNNNDFPLLY